VRLRALAKASDLREDRRLLTKVDMSPRAITRRLRAVDEALELCRRLGRRARSKAP